MSLFTTILIASPSPIVREGLKALLHPEADLYWIGDATSGAELLARARDVRVDVVLFDLDLNEGQDDWLERVRQIADSKLVALADAWNDARIVNALRAGAHGFITRRSSASDIAQAIRAALSGQLALNPAASELLRQQFQSDEQETLSPREREVLRALARGLPNKLIAHELVISEHTVKFHIRSILDKLGATNRTEAVRLGIERGLVAI
jgi:DNA-binding NarL/FixJ family response regulator